MADIQKPLGMNNIWAENGLKAPADPSKIDQGWVVEKPPYQTQNWLDNKQDTFQAHVNQHGIPYKDNETEYQANKSYVVDPISGIVYKCIVTHVNQPVTNSIYWDIAFSPYEAMVPTGSTQMFAGTSAPRGWLIADGSAVSRTTYATLFSVIGTTYGTGNGSTTFNLPDLRGVVVRGVDRGRGLDPSRIQGTYQADLFASHSHNNTATTSTGGAHTHLAGSSDSGSHTHSMTYRRGSEASGGATYVNGFLSIVQDIDLGIHTNAGVIDRAGLHSHDISISASGSHTHTVALNNASSGGSETRMKNIALLGIIKF